VDALALVKALIKDEHDLIHKATGWTLREIGKKDEQLLEEFLLEHYEKMPRTMLRYSIERLPEDRRRFYLRK
jgi:3-methyladenine DNA glycosylase AlkD